MMPSNYSTSLSSGSNGHNYSGLQSANMVSSMQTSTSKQSYTSYKVQSNSYTSRHLDCQPEQDNPDRPGSRLKANIDELDTLLSDLNNAQSTSNNNRHQETSSEDYGDHLQGQVKKTISSMNEYTMSAGSSSCKLEIFENIKAQNKKIYCHLQVTTSVNLPHLHPIGGLR